MSAFPEQHRRIRTSKDDSAFAHYTIVSRLPVIARNVVSDNTSKLDEEAKARVEAVAKEFEQGAAVHAVEDDHLRSSQADVMWPYDAKAMDGHLGKCVADEEWLWVESYFYRLLLTATKYFNGNPLDIFKVPKLKALEDGMSLVRQNAPGSNAAAQQARGASDAALMTALTNSLWGNQVDLCFWNEGDEEKPSKGAADISKKAEAGSSASAILCDARAEILSYLRKVAAAGRPRVTFILDNSGPELLCDLFLGDLLVTALGAEVTYHVKPHPYYVSDVNASDIDDTVARLAEETDAQVADVGKRWQGHLDSGCWRVRTHAFWCAPEPFHMMPEDLRKELEGYDLAFSKGDLNYRKIVADLWWPETAPFAEASGHFPSKALAALRVCKSNTVVGLADGMKERLDGADPEWRVNGKYAVAELFLR